MKECHKCEFFGKKDDECMSCCKCDKEQYSYSYGHTSEKNTYYIGDKQQMKQGQTDFSDDDQDMDVDMESLDKFRKFLFDLFDLPPLELLCLKAIMNGQSLTEFAKSMEKLFKRNNKDFTRCHAFQLRKSMAARLPKLKAVLATKGQRKQLL